MSSSLHVLGTINNSEAIHPRVVDSRDQNVGAKTKKIKVTNNHTSVPAS